MSVRRSARIAAKPAAYYFRNEPVYGYVNGRAIEEAWDEVYKWEHTLTCLTLLQTTKPGVALVLPMAGLKRDEAVRKLVELKGADWEPTNVFQARFLKPWCPEMMGTGVMTLVPTQSGRMKKEYFPIKGSEWELTVVGGKQVIYCSNKLAGMERQTPIIFTNGLPCEFH
jgi:hypothetical protein